MILNLFKTLWGHRGGIDEAIADCQDHEFNGVEGQAPSTVAERQEFSRKLSDAGLQYVAEICTAGSYVPERHATVSQHLESFRRQAEASMQCDPLFITVIAGCDAWSISESVDFFGKAIETADQLKVTASFETHRSRSLFNPWVARDILKQLPEMRLTCDFSHWCVVCERLIDTEPDVLALCAERAYHVHARVGYDQGPQVPHPAAPEYQKVVEAHERWWLQIWQSQHRRGLLLSTMTPEFGPDGYLQCQPFTGKPVADLLSINHWMAERQRDRFSKIFPKAKPVHDGKKTLVHGKLTQK